MIAAPSPLVPSAGLARPALARERALQARAALRDCHWCHHDCGADRLEGPLGPCGADGAARVFFHHVETGDELCLVPVYAVSFSACDLRCAFCNALPGSWNPRAGEVFDAAAIGARARSALAGGARSVMVLGGEPTVHLHAALALAAELPAEARLIWKTNGHGTAAARSLLAGVFDLWLVDYKFGNDGCAQALAGVPGYLERLRENLAWAADHARLIVRHQLLPGHGECCWQPIAQWLAANLPGVEVSLREGYWPARTAVAPELRRVLSPREIAAARAVARQCGLNLVP
jgi:putative pyruvate formate lyase activating enzyme